MIAARKLGDWVSGADLSGYPAARVVAAQAFADTIGCAIAGWRDPVSGRALQAALGWGAGNGTVLGSTVKAAPEAAAFVNGTAAHALDYDDCEVVASTHNSAVMVPAILALAERHGSSGRRAIDAYIAGFETIIRIGEAIGYGHYTTGWHATSTTGTIGAAAACARLLGLDAGQAATALSIAATMTGGYKLQFGTDTKPVHAGLAASAGLRAATLAASGITANPDALDAPGGFIDIMTRHSAPGFDRPLAKLGWTLALDEYGLLVKPYPSCSYTHRPIDAMLSLRPQIPEPDRIQRIEVKVPEAFAAVAGKANPETPPEARFSISWCIAAAAIDGAVRIAHMEPDSLTRTDVRNLENRIKVTTYAPENGATDLCESAPDTLKVFLKDGKILSTTLGKVRGSPTWPMSDDVRRAKFIDCLSQQYDAGKADKLFDQLGSFDGETPVSELIAPLTLDDQ